MGKVRDIHGNLITLDEEPTAAPARLPDDAPPLSDLPPEVLRRFGYEHPDEVEWIHIPPK